MDSKEYLLLYTYTDENGYEERSYQYITGRENTFIFIRNMIESIDVLESKVIVTHLPVNEGITVYDFMKYIQLNFNQYIDDGFDIDSYNY